MALAATCALARVTEFPPPGTVRHRSPRRFTPRSCGCAGFRDGSWEISAVACRYSRAICTRRRRLAVVSARRASSRQHAAKPSNCFTKPELYGVQIMLRNGDGSWELPVTPGHCLGAFASGMNSQPLPVHQPSAGGPGSADASRVNRAWPGRWRVDQPTFTGELGPAPDAYTHYSPAMIAVLSETAGRSALYEGGPFFLRQAGGQEALSANTSLQVLPLCNSPSSSWPA